MDPNFVLEDSSAFLDSDGGSGDELSAQDEYSDPFRSSDSDSGEDDEGIEMSIDSELQHVKSFFLVLRSRSGCTYAYKSHHRFTTARGSLRWRIMGGECFLTTALGP
ncbi:hypothetical protein F441_21845 [Phytophthora nicotianae CJ01A1]|uniref:Uncharacterized protein n=1 Tax=Phytophthora nicotianae CJ01A1 TaxID=1317063 RepID=W2VSX1_PHYNI|nr:hypothetical protein F441_21845 [Phytophthora nicotianae CJ01A1]